VRLRGAAAALAAADGHGRAPRRVRPHGAHPRLRLRQPRDPGHPGGRRLGAQRGEEVDRQRLDGRDHRGVGPRGRGRPGQGFRGPAGERGLHRHDHPGKARPAGHPPGAPPVRERLRARGERAAGGTVLQEHRRRPVRDARWPPRRSCRSGWPGC
jgi:hypothetical protein